MLELAEAVALHIPGAQGVHEAAEAAEYVPGAHGEHTKEPNVLYVPAAHAAQPDADASPLTELAVPAGQG